MYFNFSSASIYANTFAHAFAGTGQEKLSDTTAGGRENKGELSDKALPSYGLYSSIFVHL